MSSEKHAAHRAWAFEGLDRLQSFLEDSDFEGSQPDEAALLDRTRIDLRDGKYRVVFLGAFNVGKSTLLNAFLGDEYLPSILEECTTKITHILRGDAMRSVLRLSGAVNDDDVRALTGLMQACHIDATVEKSEDAPEIIISYKNAVAKDLQNSLNALITFNADEDFPLLKEFRKKFDELVVYLPNDRIEEDIALVDSPGVHSISETNTKIVQDIIPSCHLVICLLDSQSAGNEHNKGFIESIVKHRHRKVFFVINKSDQLNPHEIDPAGRRGPAKDLFRWLNGIVPHPELFFVSSLYGVVAAQLAGRRVTLDEVGDNNKIKVPFNVQQRIFESKEPAREAAAYLLEKSNFPALQSRLLDYLYTENREGAIVETVCRFINDTAWRYARPMETKVELARNVPRLTELRRQRADLTDTIARNQEESQRLLVEFQTMANGGSLNGFDYQGYETQVADRLSKTLIDEDVMKPLKAWVANDENLQRAKAEDYRPLTLELEKNLDAFIQRTQTEINQAVEAVESQIRARASKSLGGADALFVEPSGSVRANIVSIDASMGGSYLTFGFVGAVVGAAAGAGLAAGVPGLWGAASRVQELVDRLNLHLTPQAETILGTAVAGLAVGALLGMILRSFKSDDARREKLNARIAEKVEQILQRDVRAQLLEQLEKRRETFAQTLQQAFDAANTKLQHEISVISNEEAELVRIQDEIVGRLAPKIEKLSEIGRSAREIVEATAPKETE
ncbi:MAG: dynamin family protein [Candidatus Hydrogenedentes bacterium]|nr:dynamin family protein [Candidatus Hydrogenedentota bacterium]